MTINLKTRFIKSIVGIALIGTLATPFLLASCAPVIEEPDYAKIILQAYEEMDTYLRDRAIPTAEGTNVDFSNTVKNDVGILEYFDDNFDERVWFNSIVFEEYTKLSMIVEAAKNNFVDADEYTDLKVSRFNFTHSANSFTLDYYYYYDDKDGKPTSGMVKDTYTISGRNIISSGTATDSTTVYEKADSGLIYNYGKVYHVYCSAAFTDSPTGTLKVQ
jgi:hypothetical protein